MDEDRIVKFCAQVGLRSIGLVMTNFSPNRRGQAGQVTLTTPLSGTVGYPKVNT